MSAAEAQEIAKLSVDNSKGVSNDDASKLLFQLVESIHEKNDTEEALYQESLNRLSVWKLGRRKPPQCHYRRALSSEIL